jgi:type IV secretory pathway TrbF-like protein
MPISRNWLFLIIGALIVAVAALSYKVYDDHKEPKGVQLNIGPSGISVQKK